MTKFLIAFVGIVVVGIGALAQFSGALAYDLMIFAFAILAGSAFVKVVIDIVLHFSKEDEDREAEDTVLDEPKGRTFYDIKKYARALKNKRRKKKKRGGSAY